MISFRLFLCVSAMTGWENGIRRKHITDWRAVSGRIPPVIFKIWSILRNSGGRSPMEAFWKRMLIFFTAEGMREHIIKGK